MNKKLSKTLIKHCNACFLTQRGLINSLQNFWNLDILVGTCDLHTQCEGGGDRWRGPFRGKGNQGNKGDPKF
jgi:hypothetical protein